jgi:hypothetical protein
MSVNRVISGNSQIFQIVDQQINLRGLRPIADIHIKRAVCHPLQFVLLYPHDIRPFLLILILACVGSTPPAFGLSTPTPVLLFICLVHHPVSILHFAVLASHCCFLFLDQHLFELLIAFGFTLPYGLALLQDVEIGSFKGTELAFPAGGEANVQFPQVVIVEIRE